MAALTGGTWKLDTKGKLSYVLDETNVTVVTITGLSNLTTDEDGVAKVLVGSEQKDVGTYITFSEPEAIEGTNKSGDKVTTGYKGTVTLAAAVLGTAKVTIANGKYEGVTFNATLELAKAKLTAIETAKKTVEGEEGEEPTTTTESTETLTYNAAKGEAYITANLTAGYVVAADKKSATYSDRTINATLATISGLRKGLAEDSTALDTMKISNNAEDDGTGIVTLTKAQDGNDMFTNSNIVIAKNTKNVPFANNLSYTLALGGEYEQEAEDPYWELGKKNSATYKFETPTGYVSAGDTQINVQKAFTTVIATVSGLNADAVVGKDEEDGSSVIGTYQEVEDPNDSTATTTKFVKGLEITAEPPSFNEETGKLEENGEGVVTTTISDSGVLPKAKGTFAVAAAKNYTLSKDGITSEGVTDFVQIDEPSKNVTMQYLTGTYDNLFQNIWVIKGNTATYKKVRLAYYDTSVENKITYVPQADLITLTTITGLDAEALAANAVTETVQGSEVITSITGLNFDNEGPDAEYKNTGTDQKPSYKWVVTGDPATLTIDEVEEDEYNNYSLLGGKNITIGKSDNVRLAIDATKAPTFENQKWNLSGTTATLKGNINAGYTASDDGRSIVYTADATNAQLAKITGLKKGTYLQVSTSGIEGEDGYDDDVRTIGYNSGTDGAFVQGVEHSTDALSYAEEEDETTGTKKLDKLDITISANVLDTSKVALTSTFYKLALDNGTDTTKGGKVETKPDAKAVKYFTVSGTTATYKQATSRPYYTLNNGTSITYTKEVSPITLATIKGISANANINIYGDDSNKSDSNDIYIDEDGVITIKKNALNDSTITVTKGTKNIPDDEKDADYTLALGSDVTEASDLKWSQSGNTVYLKAGTGYEVSGDGKSIAYTKEDKETTIAQITGLRTGIFTGEFKAFATDESTDPATTEVNEAVSNLGIVLNKEDGTITLDKRVLNEATVSLSGTGNYTLEADTDTDNAVPTAAEEGENRWVLSKDTATFKAVNTSYYDTEKKANTLTFVAATNAAEPVNYVTISGIATDLVADPDNPTVLGYYTTETDTDDTDATGSGNVDADSSDETETTEPTFKPAIKISIDDEDAPVVTIVDSHALAGKNVTINSKSSKDGATLTLDTTQVTDVTKAELDGTASWSIDKKGNATYKGKIKAYYSNQSDENNKTILFHKEAPSAAIATITGLNTSLTADDLNNESTGLTFGTDDSENEITIRNSMLAGKDVTLTTGVQLKGTDYKLVLDDDVTTYDDLEDGTSKHEGWSIVDNKKTGSTATYGEYTDEYYDIDDEGTALTYKAAGFNKQYAKLFGEGLKSGLVTIKDDLLSEIKVENKTFTMTADAIVDGKNVKLETLDDAGEEDTYTMAIGSGINTFKTDSYDNYYCKATGDNEASKTVNVYGAKDAGYTVEEATDENPQTLTYHNKETGQNNEVYGTITGLLAGVKEDSDGRITGIEVDTEKKIITLTDAVLPQSEVTFTSAKSYKLAYDGIAPNDNGEAYILNSDGDLEIYAGVKIGGHTLSGNTITYTAGSNPDATPTLKISGLKNLKSSSNAMTAGITENKVDGISIDGKVIKLSKNVLDTDEVKIISGTGYTLALDKETVTKTTSTDDWSFDQSKGVATFTQAITEGYKVGSDNQSVTYTAAKTVTSTLNNLSKENLSESDLGKDDDTNKKIVFADGVFTVNDKDALANKDVTLTIKSSVKSDVPAYTIALGTDVAATKEDYVWTKAEGDTKATLTQVTKSGYSLSSDAKKITYSSDPTTATLATISGLNKTIAAQENENPKDDGTDFATTIEGISVENGVITISKNDILTTGNVTLGKNDKYTFALGDNVTKKSSSIKGFAAVKGGLAYKDINSAYYSTDTTGKTITYNKSTADGDDSFTITGLNANAVPDATGAIGGISVSGNVVTLSSNVLSTNAKTPITISGGDYTLKLADGIATAKEDDVTEWVASGSNYIYRTYTKDYYTIAEDKKSIKYTAPVTNKNNDFITISGLAADKVDKLKAASSRITTAEGTITLSSDLLDSKQVKLTTKGSHTLELDSTDTDITESTITTTGTGEGWSTNKTTATLKGTIGAGYAVNEAGNVVNYYSTDKSGQTIATISGLKSGATIDANDDVETGDDGYTTVTLDKDQLATSKVTIKGDFYKLNVANDAASQTDYAKWIKADGKTNATYTQTTYKGFSPSADGKTLTYLSKTTNVNLASVSGLNKDLSLDDMAVNGSINGEAVDNPLLNIDDDAKTITFNSKSALNLGNVTLGKNDTYKLAFSEDSIFATETVADHLTFNKGTANIMSGTSASWTKTNDKLLSYTAGKETVVSAITGLSKNLAYDSTTSSIQGITLNGNNSIVMGKSAVEGTTSIKLDNKTDDKKYKFVFASSGSDSLEEYNSASSTADTKRWDLTSTALTLKGVKSEGYSLTDSLISYNAADDTGNLAVITGISNKLFKKDSAGEIVVSKTGKQAISLSGGTGIALTDDFKEAIKGTSVTMSITSGNYTFATGNTPSVIPGSKELIGTNISLNGTAAIQKTNPEGWMFESQSPKVISYTPGGTTTYVTINGLNKEYTVGNGGTSFRFDNSSGSITAGQSVLGASNVTMSRPKGSSTVESFKFILGSDVNSSQNDSTKDNWKNQTEWVTSNGTASYKLYDKANYYLKDDTKNNLNSIIYVAPTKGTQFAAISGMAKDATLDSTAGVSGGTITLGKNQLEGITKAVTLKVTQAKHATTKSKDSDVLAALDKTNKLIDTGNDTAADFKLALDSEIQKSLSTAKDAVWDTNGTKAVLTGTITKGYAISTDQKTITYNTADKAGQTIAQITGLKSGSEITKDDVSIAETLSSGALSTTISLGADHLGTSNVVISKGEGYKFAFVDEVVTADEKDQWKDRSEWVASKGTFVYKTYNKAYWDLNEAETTAIYHKPVDENPAKVEGSKHKTFVTIKGLTTGITGSTDSIGVATSTSGGAQVRNGDGVITLTADVLNKAKVTLTDNIGYGYSLALGDDVTNKSDVSTIVAAVATSKGVTSVTWTGTRGVGYHVANDGQSVEYFSAAKAKQTVAQVSGLKSEVTKDDIEGSYNSSSNIVNLTGDSLTTAVGIGGIAEFSFDNKFNNGTITGSKAADKVSIAGGGVSINAGAGNDYVSFASGSRDANTFLYASGNGNDVVANFATSDTIKITNHKAKTAVSAKVDNGDVVVTVDKGSIRLKGLTSDSGLNIVNSAGTAIDYTKETSTSNVLADDNFATTPQLSSIVKASASTYSTEDLVATDATSLTKQSSAIAYSGSSKK